METIQTHCKESKETRTPYQSSQAQIQPTLDQVHVRIPSPTQCWRSPGTGQAEWKHEMARFIESRNPTAYGLQYLQGRRKRKSSAWWLSIHQMPHSFCGQTRWKTQITICCRRTPHRGPSWERIQWRRFVAIATLGITPGRDERTRSALRWHWERISRGTNRWESRFYRWKRIRTVRTWRTHVDHIQGTIWPQDFGKTLVWEIRRCSTTRRIFPIKGRSMCMDAGKEQCLRIRCYICGWLGMCDAQPSRVLTEAERPLQLQVERSRPNWIPPRLWLWTWPRRNAVLHTQEIHCQNDGYLWTVIRRSSQRSLKPFG